MALLYNKYIGNTILDCAIRGLTAPTNPASGVVSQSQDWYIMSGIQPTPADAIANWETYYSSNRLFHGYNSLSTGITLTINNRSSLGAASITSSGTRTAAASGTATWAVIATRVGGNPGSTGLTSDPSFMIVPVSATGGNGILQLSTINLTASSSFSYNFILYMGGGSN